MDSDEKRDDEIDIFELAGAEPGERIEYMETETNVFSVDTLRHAAVRHNDNGGEAADRDPAAAPDGIGSGGIDKSLDNDFSKKKGGFFSKLFRKDKPKEEDADELSLDDDMFIAPPQASGRARVAKETPEITDSGVFELGPSTKVPVSSETGNESKPVTAEVPEVTDSGIFEFKPPAADTVHPDTADKVTPVDTDVNAKATEVTDSGIFELAPPAAPPPPHDASNGDEWEIGWEPVGEGAADNEPAPITADTAGAADSGIFELGPSAGAPSDAAAGTDAPPPVFTKLAHVCLYVKDLGRSVEFYGKLGFQKRFAFNRNGSLFGAYLEFGNGNFIELFEDVSRSATTALGRLAHFCLETPDIDAVTESLSARGVVFTPKKLGCDSTYQIWLKDPDGNEFEIHQYTPNSSQLVGGEVEADW
jgi:lactoylglutathione lyase/glyoxylase I family protein